MDQSERIERIEEGQSATLAHGFLVGPVGEFREILLSRMIANYRSGNTQHDVLLGGIAEIAALDSLMKHLDTLIQRGNLAAATEYK